MPAVAFAGFMVPSDEFIGKPEGNVEKLPDLSPVRVTVTGAAVDELQRLEGEYAIVADGPGYTLTVIAALGLSPQ